MPSQLDNLILAGTATDATRIGTDDLVITKADTSTVTVTGAWSSVSNTDEAEEGGVMPDVNAVVSVPSAAGIDRTLVGRPATGKSQSFRVVNVDVGEVLTSIMLRDVMSIL